MVEEWSRDVFINSSNAPNGENEEVGPNIGETELSKPSEVEVVEPLSPVILDKDSTSFKSTLKSIASADSISSTSPASLIEEAESYRSVVF